jgi:hypothetical protein
VLPDHAALELGEGASDLKHEPTGRRDRVDCSLIEVQRHAGSFEVLDRAQQVDQ